LAGLLCVCRVVFDLVSNFSAFAKTTLLLFLKMCLSSIPVLSVFFPFSVAFLSWTGVVRHSRKRQRRPFFLKFFPSVGIAVRTYGSSFLPLFSPCRRFRARSWRFLLFSPDAFVFFGGLMRMLTRYSDRLLPPFLGIESPP